MTLMTRLVCGLLAAGPAGLLGSTAWAQSDDIVYSFGRGQNDGGGPTSLISVDNVLYGTTASGGSQGRGTVFSLTPGGRETILYSFQDGSDGYSPQSLISVNGVLYGVTSKGGTHRHGTVFSVTSGVEKVIYSFLGQVDGDGQSPSVTLLDVGGILYGTTMTGGIHGHGTVFSVTPEGVETVLYSFPGNNGENPGGGLIEVNGKLYGTTTKGGIYHGGTVYSLTFDGRERVVYSFNHPECCAQSSLVEYQGVLYGTATSGFGGSLFGVRPDGVLAVDYPFPFVSDSPSGPAGPLTLVGGILYGTSRFSTISSSASANGTVYSFTTSAGTSILHSFPAFPNDGIIPQTGVISLAGKLYGTTAGGGVYKGGTVFSLPR